MKRIRTRNGVKIQGKIWRLTADFPGYGKRTIICRGYNDAVHLRRVHGGTIS